MKVLLIMVILSINGNVEVVTHTVKNMETCAVVIATVSRALEGYEIVNTSCIPQ